MGSAERVAAREAGGFDVAGVASALILNKSKMEVYGRMEKVAPSERFRQELDEVLAGVDRVDDFEDPANLYYEVRP